MQVLCSQYATVRMLVLKLPPFFPHLHGKGESAAISKLADFLVTLSRSYIAIVIGLRYQSYQTALNLCEEFAFLIAPSFRFLLLCDPLVRLSCLFFVIVCRD